MSEPRGAEPREQRRTVLVEAVLTAYCKCGAIVTLRPGTFSLVQHGGCGHYVGVEQLDGVYYVRFREA